MDQLSFYHAKLAFEIDAADLKNALDRHEAVIIVDARSADAYRYEHIPGAINLPHRTINEASISTLDKNALYVSYCDGIGCNASTKGAIQLAQHGFNVRELIGGLDWWKRDGHPTEQGNEHLVRTGDDVHCGCN